jgi:hypothetical protein
LIPIGIFTADVLGDGVKTVQVKFWSEIAAYWWANDATTPIVLADRGTLAYIKDDTTVSGDDTGRSALGLVLDVNSTDGVLVYAAYPFVPDVVGV